MRRQINKPKNKKQWKLLWWSSGQDSMLPLQQAQVGSLIPVGELRSCKPCGTVKNKQKNFLKVLLTKCLEDKSLGMTHKVKMAICVVLP